MTNADAHKLKVKLRMRTNGYRVGGDTGDLALLALRLFITLCPE